MRGRRSTIKNKISIKHGSTLVANVGPGDGSFFRHLIFNTDVGQRSTDGAPQTIKNAAKTDEQCNVGDEIRYVNICIQCSPRGADSTNIKDDCGWLEWGLIWQQEEGSAMAVTNIGTDNLGVLLGRFARQNAIMSGCFPIGSRQSMSADLHIKIPKRMGNLRIGTSCRLYCYARGSSSTDTRTDSFRLLVSSQFKSYS